MKYLVIILSLVLLIKCKSETKSTFEKQTSLNESEVANCNDSVFLEKEKFPLKNIKFVSHDKIYEFIKDFPELNDWNSKKLKCNQYYSDNSYNKNFNTYLLFQRAECEDCNSFIYLVNLSTDKGCIIDKVQLSTEYYGENYNYYFKTEFHNDSSFSRVDYYISRQATDSTEYGPNWEEKVITNDFLINSTGLIELLQTDTVKNIYDRRP